MKKLKRANLFELVQRKEILSCEMQRTFIGGGDGSMSNPYTQMQYLNLVSNNTFLGGLTGITIGIIKRLTLTDSRHPVLLIYMNIALLS